MLAHCDHLDLSTSKCPAQLAVLYPTRVLQGGAAAGRQRLGSSAGSAASIASDSELLALMREVRLGDLADKVSERMSE